MMACPNDGPGHGHECKTTDVGVPVMVSVVYRSCHLIYILAMMEAMYLCVRRSSWVNTYHKYPQMRIEII